MFTPHSSHITQPLDVGFFSPLKRAWKRAVTRYNFDNPGMSVDKTVFAKVFRDAYLDTVKPGNIVNAFRGSGIFPVNRCAINEKKIVPAQVHAAAAAEKSKPVPTGSRLALLALEEELQPEILHKYEARWEEKYDLDDNPVYNTWKRLKQKSSRIPLTDITSHSNINPLDQVLQVPTKVTQKPKSIQGTACLPKHLSGPEIIKFLEEQKRKKENEEKEKEEQREERKKEREAEERDKEERRHLRAAAKAEREEERRREKRKRREKEGETTEEQEKEAGITN